MDTAYLHIVLNHLPIIGIPFGLGLLLLGILARNDSIKRAALFSFVILGVLTIPVYLTGQGGEDFVEEHFEGRGDRNGDRGDGEAPPVTQQAGDPG